MKELSIEEKATAYDKAVERAKVLKEHLLEINEKDYADEIDYIFSELAESEDERIKKGIIYGLKYLERELSWDFVGNVDILDAYAWLEKQGKQKPADKVEPKFKVGDWIISKYMHLIMQISNNDNGCYETIEIDGTKRNDSYDFIERNFRLWTIEDAKPGDVLASKDGQSILIFRKLDTSTSFSSYYNIQGKGELGWSNECFIPATKEQRDLLFQKMRESGYEWDAEKKELKKIKYTRELDNSYACVKFPFEAKVKSTGAIVKIHGGQLSQGGKEWIKYQSDVKDGYKVYEPNDLELVYEIEQKQVIDYPDNLQKDNWELIHEFVNKFGRIPKDEDELNVLIEYVFKRQRLAWSEEDEKTFEYALDMVEWYSGKNEDKSRLVSDWLKSLKERVQPQN